jgi:hypothetical protein
MSLGYLVAELFEPNCRICFTFRQQDSHAFTAHNDARLLCGSCFSGLCNGSTNALEKSNRVRHPIYHERRKRLSHIYCNVVPILNGLPNIQALILQSFKKTIPVRRGGHNDGAIPHIQSGSDNTSKVVKKNSFI